jgi:ribose-phosphate pyrophosphokinase
MDSAQSNSSRLKVFSGRANPELSLKIARELKDSLGQISVSSFPDGETQVRIDEDVRGRDIFVVQPTCTPVNENLMELLIILDAFKRSSAFRVTAVVPYYGYARQDRKDQGRVPITAKLVADLLTSAGADRVLALDLHAAQIQGFFDIPVDHLFAVPVIESHIRALRIPEDEFVVLSPDEGSIKKSLNYQRALGGGQLAIIDKRRESATETKQANVIGASLAGKTAVIFDDMISTGGTAIGAARIAKEHGAKHVYVCATHGVLSGPAVPNLKDAFEKGFIDEVVITDSIPLSPEKQLPQIQVVTVSKLLAEAIKRIHRNESVSYLFRSHKMGEVR